MSSSILIKVLPIFIIIAILGLSAGGYFYYQYQQSKKEIENLKNNPQVNPEEAQRLVDEVGKLIELPADEQPTIATVTDPEKLKDQPFFSKSKTGDKVLIYSNAKKAILYDPVARKIVDIAPVNIGSPSGEVAPSAGSGQAGEGPKIVLRNGTSTTGLTTKVESDVKNSLSTSQITKKENASKQDYEETIIVVLNNKFSSDGEKLAKDLGGSVEDLPEGEDKPDADILVILGKDKT